MKVIELDGLVKSPITSFLVIPAKAGIQVLRALTECLDPGFHRGDDFLRSRQIWLRAKACIRVMRSKTEAIIEAAASIARGLAPLICPARI